MSGRIPLLTPDYFQIESRNYLEFLHAPPWLLIFREQQPNPLSFTKASSLSAEECSTEAVEDCRCTLYCLLQRK